LRMTRIRFPAEGSILRLTACTRTCGNKTWYRIGLGVLVIKLSLHKQGERINFFAKIGNFLSFIIFVPLSPLKILLWIFETREWVKSLSQHQTLRPRTR
jgi:hypothetical protein